MKLNKKNGIAFRRFFEHRLLIFLYFYFTVYSDFHTNPGAY